MSKQIPVTRGKIAIIDDEDFEMISKHSWHLQNDGYAMTTFRVNKKSEHFLMHRMIMNTPKGMETDHINHNRLDNRRENLRICTSSQNKANQLPMTNNTSGYKGVCFDKRRNKWQARIGYNGKSLHLGCFDDVNEASEAYAKRKAELYGEFADDALARLEQK